MHNQKSLVISVAAISIGMFCLAFAAVPLYRIFCQVTGFGGTPQIAKQLPKKILDREITVRFNADTAQDLPWDFKPLQKETTVRIGENKLIFYYAENRSNRPIIGMATFNVLPEHAGQYFSKIHCFCFEKQTLKPHERQEMPVSFFIDPKILEDSNTKDIKTITLSYSFFKSK